MPNLPFLTAPATYANNAGYCDKESAGGGHFLYRTFLKIVVEYALILKKSLTFARRQQSSAYCLLNFKRSDLKCTKSSRIFRIFTVYNIILTMMKKII